VLIPTGIASSTDSGGGRQRQAGGPTIRLFKMRRTQICVLYLLYVSVYVCKYLYYTYFTYENTCIIRIRFLIQNTLVAPLCVGLPPTVYVFQPYTASIHAYIYVSIRKIQYVAYLFRIGRIYNWMVYTQIGLFWFILVRIQIQTCQRVALAV
jgi:hypothetical protein